MQERERYQQARRVTLVSAVVNALLAVLKVIIGVVGHSQALLADGVHSLSDLVTDVMVLFAAKAGSHGPDEDHPYGHGRIETVVVVALAVFLIVVGLGIAIDAIVTIAHHDFGPAPSVIVLIMAAVSTLSNEGLFRYTFYIGNKIDSNLLRANAWHNRSDALSSIIVLIGAGGTMLGIHFLDAAAAIIVSLLIIKMGVKMAWQSIRELVDTGMDAETVDQLMKVIAETPGVNAVHQMRSRSLAGKFFVDVHVQVDPRISVSEGHFIGDQVYRHVHSAFSYIKDITVHIDSEDDETANPSAHLPDRRNLEKHLGGYWQGLPGYSEISTMQLDYLDGKVYIQLLMPLSVLTAEFKAADLEGQYQQAVSSVDYIAEIKVVFQAS